MVLIHIIKGTTVHKNYINWFKKAIKTLSLLKRKKKSCGGRPKPSA